MATKIQLRRDLAANWTGTNPVLAQGEPGVELDTRQMKIGDGISAWNDLAYAAGGAGGEQSTENMFVKLSGQYGNIDENWQGVISVSEDGLNWTPSTYNQWNTGRNAGDVNRLAVGGGRVVYVTYDYESECDQLRWAYNPFDKPNLATSDVSRRGPHGEDINWYNVRYVNNMFVAVGSYYDTDRNDYYYPYAAHSTDGNVWTRINFDLSYINGKIIDEENADTSNFNGIGAYEVAYGGGGYLISLHYGPQDSTTSNRLPAGAFYVTSLDITLNGTNWTGGIPGTYLGAFDGMGWVAWSSYDAVTSNGSVLHINASTDPTAGSWTAVDLDTVGQDLIGQPAGHIYDVAAGTIDGVSWIVAGTEHYGAFASNDQGASWRVVQTRAEDYAISYVDNTSPAKYTTWEDSYPDDGEKITILGSGIAQLDGVRYSNYMNGPAGWGYYLYTDKELTVPLNAAGWGDYTFNANPLVTGRYGDHTVVVSTASGLVVGMQAEGYGGSPLVTVSDDMYGGDPNTITAIDGTNVTMKYPWHGDDGDSESIEFYPVLKRSYGDGIASLAYGDGAFIGTGANNSERTYRTTDLVTWTAATYGNQKNNWGNWDYNYTNSVAYGAVSTPKALLRNSSETLPGYTNYLSVSDTLDVKITGGDPEWSATDQAYPSGAPGYGEGILRIDPAKNSWNIGSVMSAEGYQDENNYGSYGVGIGTYWSGDYDPTDYGTEPHDSVAIKTWDQDWTFDNEDGFFTSNNIDVHNNAGARIRTRESYNSVDPGYVRIQAPYGSSGQGYAQLEWDDTNFLYVDTDGTTIESDGVNWNFSHDCNGDGYGVVYNPSSTQIQISGYWKIGDYDYDWQNAYIKAEDWSDPEPCDIYIHAGNSGGSHHYVFDRYGVLHMDLDGVVQSSGYWAIGDYDAFDSYTYVGATDNIDNDAYDIIVSADDTAWYFNRTGTFQLPAGGDIVDDNGDSVLSKDLPQTLQNTGADYTLVYGDRGRHIYVVSAGDILVPTNASVAYPIGTMITMVTDSTHACKLKAVDGGTTTLILSQTGAVNPTTGVNLSADTYATILKIATDKWMVQVA